MNYEKTLTSRRYQAAETDHLRNTLVDVEIAACLARRRSHIVALSAMTYFALIALQFLN